jgi:hypothetical protein
MLVVSGSYQKCQNDTLINQLTYIERGGEVLLELYFDFSFIIYMYLLYHILCLLSFLSSAVTEQFLPDLSYNFTVIVRFEKHLSFGLGGPVNTRL